MTYPVRIGGHAGLPGVAIECNPYPESVEATGSSTGEASPDEVRIILADDHEIVRQGIRMVLESEPGFSVVAESADVETARRRTQGLKPDVLILDLTMPGGSSLTEIPAILEASPSTRVIALTMQEDPAFARAAFANGACGYVIKRSAGRELLHAIREALSGGTYISPSLGARIAAGTDGPPGGLSPKEAEVLTLIADGYTNPEIAERLILSVRTVESHRASINTKLGASSRHELVKFARRHGLSG